MATLKITQSEHQTITVSDLESKVYQSGDTVEAGKELIATIEADKDYKAGTLNKDTVTVQESDTEIEFSASAAIKCVVLYNGTKYATFNEAIAEVPAKTESTITLLEDIYTSGIEVGKEKVTDGSQDKYITFDLKGHTITIAHPDLVGSPDTVTNGLRFLKGSKVTIKDGTITTNYSECKIMIQNYVDLVLDNVTVDITTGENARYAISNNYGGLTCKGNTIINAAGTYTVNGVEYHRVAFDCYYGLGKTYYDAAPVITFGKDFTGKVIGAIEYGKASAAPDTLPGTDTKWTESAKIVIENGTFDIETSGVSNPEEASITINGGKFVHNEFPEATIPDNWKTDEYKKKEEQEEEATEDAALTPVINYILDMFNMR